MISANDAITAFLAALVATPDGEPLPPFNQGLFDDPDQFIDDAEDETGRIPFWTKYDTFHAQLAKGYTAKERTKNLRLPDGSPEEARGAGTKEPGNVMISAAEILGSEDAIASARKAFQTSGYTDHLSWAVGITGWQP